MVAGAALAGLLVWRRRRLQRAPRPLLPRSPPASPKKRPLLAPAATANPLRGAQRGSPAKREKQPAQDARGFYRENPLRAGAADNAGGLPSPLALPSPALQGAAAAPAAQL